MGFSLSFSLFQHFIYINKNFKTSRKLVLNIYVLLERVINRESRKDRHTLKEISICYFTSQVVEQGAVGQNRAKYHVSSRSHLCVAGPQTLGSLTLCFFFFFSCFQRVGWQVEQVGHTSASICDVLQAMTLKNTPQHLFKN